MKRLAEKNRKDLILDVAVELFSTQGFNNVSTRDLADRAGLSRSHLYHYFKDWPTLRRAAFVRFADNQYEKSLGDMTGLSPRQALASFLRECLPNLSDRSDAIWWDAWDEAVRDPELAAAFREIETRWLGLLATIIQQGVDDGDFRCAMPARVAKQLFCMAVGYADTLALADSAEANHIAFDEMIDAAHCLVGFKAG
ncbi:TetR/AcrR family transcriptional regulator [Bordetella ansorpii]|nr:TetR/AcrR family transcriptional regulator [Bordetella ansorpii]